MKLSAINPHDRDTCRSGVRSAMRAANRLPGRGPLLWIWPLYLHVDQKSDDDDDDDDEVICMQFFSDCWSKPKFHTNLL